MSGRPKKIVDPALSKQLSEALVTLGIRAGDLARTLHVSPATLSRAINYQAFSAPTKMAVERWLATQTLPPDIASISRDDALRILREFDSMVPAIMAALSIVLDENDSRSPS